MDYRRIILWFIQKSESTPGLLCVHIYIDMVYICIHENEYIYIYIQIMCIYFVHVSCIHLSIHLVYEHIAGYKFNLDPMSPKGQELQIQIWAAGQYPRGAPNSPK